MSNNVIINKGTGYISGICKMRNNGDIVIGSLFNEFGISAISFCYDTKTENVKLTHVMGMLDRRIVRRTIKKDIKQWLHFLQQGQPVYKNQRRDITYTLKPFENIATDNE